jgi:hypothetical protein
MFPIDKTIQELTKNPLTIINKTDMDWFVEIGLPSVKVISHGLIELVAQPTCSSTRFRRQIELVN